MNELTLLSPHRDDAVFSLEVALSRWRKSSVRLTVLNFFTESGYAPHALPVSHYSISAIRAREDRRALHAIDTRIRIESVGLLDAPLRLSIKADNVCRPEARAYDNSHDLRILQNAIRGCVLNGLALAPLALGNHVDHLLVNQAAVDMLSGRKLGFYEDLPYATWTADAALIQRVRECEERTRVALKPVVLRDGRAVRRKRQVCAFYSSQITPAEANDLARYSAKYAGGERIWIPSHSMRWTRLTNSYA